MPRGARRERALHAAGVCLAGIVFILDRRLPATAIPGAAYALVVLLGLWSRSPSYPLVAAALATALTGVDLGLEWTDPIPDVVYINRPMMVLVFWVTAALVVRFKRLEKAAAGQVKQLSDIKYALDQAAIVATTDVTGRITYVNDKFCEISKYSRDELMGQDHRIINSGLHPKEFIQNLWRTIAGGDIWHGEIRNRAKDGTYYWVDTTIVPFLNERGKPFQYTAIRSDITLRKAAERRLQEQAALARVGQMAAVVAHEVKNPLAGIKGVMQILISRRAAEDPEITIMRDVAGRIDALDELIHDLMLFARPRPPRLAAVELKPLLADAVATLRKDPDGQRVEVDLVGTEIALIADGELLKATFLNLFLNAAQAMNGRGAIRVSIENENGQCRVRVADSGPGIPESIREEIFEPFFTTKHRGGGLGLAIARRTMELHGGLLSASCPPEGGTTMTVVLPLHPPAEIGAAGVEQPPSHPSGAIH